MYEAFFELREKPFSLLPDPGFLYLSQKHQEALTLLEYGLLNQAGFIILTGEIGSGKTTLMRYLLDRLDRDVTIGLISHTHQSLGDLMDWICQAFDIQAATSAKRDLHQAFVDFLIDQYAAGKRVLLIVDEAQNLGLDKLEELRLLSNINADKDLVLQLMLLGQPQLRDLLQRAELEQFVQRVAASYHLGRLDASETEHYIYHRILIAGGKYKIFDRGACHAIHHYSKGIPRLINLLCDTALVYAYGASEKTVTAKAVDDLIDIHAPHLLIPIERDTLGRQAQRERLASEAEIGDDGLTPFDAMEIVAPLVPEIDDSRAPSPPATSSSLVRDLAREHEDVPPSVARALQAEDAPSPARASTDIVPPLPRSAAHPDARHALGTMKTTHSASIQAAERLAEEASSSVRKRRTPFQPGGLLIAFLILIAVGAAMVWLGTSSISERFRSALLDQVDREAQPATVPAATPPSDDPSTTSPTDPDSEPTAAPPAQQPEAPSERSLPSPAGERDMMTPTTPTAEGTAEVVPPPPLSQDPSPATDDERQGAPDRIEMGSSAPPGTLTEGTQARNGSASEPLRSAALADLEHRFRALPVEISAVDRDFIKVDLGESVQFLDGSTSLDTRAREVLTAIAEVLEETETAMINVIGHTDSSGTDSINQALSAQRAATVSRFLVRRGIPSERVSSEGRGKSEPKIDPEQERIIGPGVNRRIELEVRNPDPGMN
ncbi:Type II secretory pathway, component ExeA (predicted ATPase) [Thiocapsa roseopersicina]|uniref:Type II secretory pathway, component ExeA (Predicted ATPase) n=1 Tax=Thiocapsa roseopersicina TaxID=1058 RepID=A0A1H2Y5A7_THIRO|nr:Type II secretory pathway, component ExeA (predicted ATPase) [Thiocapsa roseopersicina]